jgi:hypothetical protein
LRNTHQRFEEVLDDLEWARQHFEEDLGHLTAATAHLIARASKNCVDLARAPVEASYRNPVE